MRSDTNIHCQPITMAWWSLVTNQMLTNCVLLEIEKMGRQKGVSCLLHTLNLYNLQNNSWGWMRIYSKQAKFSSAPASTQRIFFKQATRKNLYSPNSLSFLAPGKFFFLLLCLLDCFVQAVHVTYSSLLQWNTAGMVQNLDQT